MGKVENAAAHFTRSFATYAAPIDVLPGSPVVRVDVNFRGYPASPLPGKPGIRSRPWRAITNRPQVDNSYHPAPRAAAFGDVIK
jgi:hypothetical protein